MTAAPESPKPADDIPHFAPDEDDAPLTWRDRIAASLPFFDDADTLSKREAKQARETLMKAISRYGELADDAIPLFSRTHAPVVIWGDLDEHEAEALADFLLARAQSFAPAAVVVRAMVQTYSWLEVGVITGRRFYETIHYYLVNGFILSFKVRQAGPPPHMAAPLAMAR